MGSRTTSLTLAMLMLTGTLTVPALADEPGHLQDDPFSEFDTEISDLLAEWQIPGAQVAVMHNGSLVFNKGYGIAANGTDENGNYWASEVTVDSKFRIASLSKAVTSAGILTLIQNGTISLDDKMVDLIPNLLPEEMDDCDYPNHSNGHSISDINVSHLLNHRGGFNPTSDPTYWHWNRWTASWNNDPCVDKDSLIEDFEGGNLAPVPMERILSEWLRRPLDYSPGSSVYYSNIGFQILGQIIEAQSGMDYESYILDHVLTPMGIDSMSIGMTMPDQRAEGEVSYFDDLVDECHFPSGQDSNGNPIFEDAPGPDCGGFVIEEKDGGGGWIASAADYARFIAHIDGTLDSGVFDNPFDYFIANPYDTWGGRYGRGIYVMSGGDEVWRHWGAFSGSSTNFKRATVDSEPVIAVMFANTRPNDYDAWRSDREDTITDAMLTVDYSQATPLDSEELEWEWPEPLPPQDDYVIGSSQLQIFGPISASSNITATWAANISLREDYGVDLLPDRALGVRAQIDQHLGDGDGWLSIPEIADFVSLIENARDLTDSESLGCCVVDYLPLQMSKGVEVIVIPPVNGSVESNGSWGWMESADLTGLTDSRSTRILDVPRVGGVLEEIPLRVILPDQWELRYSAMQSVIEGSPGDFTVFRHQAPVASDIRITLGENMPPNAIAERQTGNSLIPLRAPTEYTGECTDSILDDTQQWWTVHRNGTMVIDSSEESLEFIAAEAGFLDGEVATINLHCMDEFSVSSTMKEDIVVDGTDPTWEATFELQVDGNSTVLDSGQTLIEVPSGSEFYFTFSASDPNGLPVMIDVTSDKSEGWRHAGSDYLEFMDRFFQGSQVNGMHLNVTERHQAKQPSEYNLSLTVTDDATNTATGDWTIIISDGSGPTIIPNIISNGTMVSPESPARAGEEVLLSLTESFDDLDAIDDVSWEVRVDGEVILQTALWSEAEKIPLPVNGAGTYLIHILAWDSVGNMEQISFGLAVSPALGVFPSVLDHHAIGDLIVGESVNIVVTMQNTGAGIGSGVLCSQDTCSDEVLVSPADASGPGVFSAELVLNLNSTDRIELRFEWTSDSVGSEGVLTIDNDYVVVSQWQMPIQVLLGVLTVLMLMAWLAHRTWGQDSQRP